MSGRHFDFWPQRAPHRVTLPETNLYFNAEVAAIRFPDKPFLVYYGTPVTFGEFRRETERLAGFLTRECGVVKGDRVLLVMQNSPQFAIGYYGILRANGIVVPVNPMSVTAELEHYVADSGARVALVAQEVYPQLQPLLGSGIDRVIVAAYSDYVRLPPAVRLPPEVGVPREELPDERSVAWESALAADHPTDPLVMGPDDLCVIPYSSGSTGRPKGCMISHRNAMHTVVTNTVWFSANQESSQLVALPYFHVTSMQGGLNAPLYQGSTMVVMTRWDREVAAELIQRYRVRSWTAISTMVVDFLANPRIAEFDLSSLELLSGGGAAMPQAIGERLETLVGSAYVEGYGLTETIAATHINPPDRPKRRCLGIPVFDTESRVIDPETLRELPHGEVGEIVTRGPQVFQGYWRDDAATAAAFIELEGRSFFRTGDLGYIDDEGYFFLVDRLKRMINAAGFKVWPTEIEAEMHRHPAIQEVCVVAARDPHRGETVKAIVVLRPEYRGRVGEQEIVEWTRARMAKYKHPRIVEFVEALPKSATGKIAWRALQDAELSRD
jgi:fatty-acyl-CoA synthase